MTLSNAGSVFSSSFGAFLAAEIHLGDIKLAMQLTGYHTSAACKSLKAPSMQTLTWFAISSLCCVQASNIDSLNAFLPGPVYAFLQWSGCFLSFSISHNSLKKRQFSLIETLTFSFLMTTHMQLRRVCRYTAPVAFDGQFWILSQSIN